MHHCTGRPVRALVLLKQLHSVSLLLAAEKADMRHDLPAIKAAHDGYLPSYTFIFVHKKKPAARRALLTVIE